MVVTINSLSKNIHKNQYHKKRTKLAPTPYVVVVVFWWGHQASTSTESIRRHYTSLNGGVAEQTSGNKPIDAWVGTPD